MYDVDVVWLARRRGDPGEQHGGVGVDRECWEVDHRRAHAHIAPEHLELAGTIDEEAPPGALGLVADEHHGVPAVWAQVSEVVIACDFVDA